MNEYLKNRLVRIHDSLYLSLIIIDQALSEEQATIELAHELSRLLNQMESGSHLKQDLKEAEAEAYRQVEEGVNHD
ncbi:hypothetical protein FOL80_07060 [Lactobacillus reuteri]|nr:hypothetical protein [Limosilactobacillus reuteri]NMV60357.1 hypothetical protein [Limosilactobacillus reuteri]NMV61864.1 hypothetical protein [Limosilactobacillus reuteri]NMV63738.1 hypothetical protein [Limosilactobacillus reuteri]NMV67326.1 hypothetical protein [Limosilactobacillus reuteri]